MEVNRVVFHTNENVFKRTPNSRTGEIQSKANFVPWLTSPDSIQNQSQFLASSRYGAARGKPQQRNTNQSHFRSTSQFKQTKFKTKPNFRRPTVIAPLAESRNGEMQTKAISNPLHSSNRPNSKTKPNFRHPSRNRRIETTA